MFTSKIKQKLKADAHALHPVVMIADKGLSPSVIAEIEAALTAHELIKIKIATGDKVTRKALSETICQKLDCALVQIIGHISIFYRKARKKK